MGCKNSGILEIGKKMPPKNIIGKDRNPAIGDACSGDLAKLAIMKPIDMKTKTPKMR